MSLPACTEENCTHIVYNQDATRVCSLSGLCFGQKLCDRFAIGSCSGGMSGIGTVNTTESIFIHENKRDQQIGNKVLTEIQIVNWVSSLIGSGEKESFVRLLSKRIKLLWDEVVRISEQESILIRRNYRRCVTVAVVVSLKEGMSARSGVIVHAHGNTIGGVAYNKRTPCLAKNIGISDMRAGQRILKTVFDTIKCKCIIKLY